MNITFVFLLFAFPFLCHGYNSAPVTGAILRLFFTDLLEAEGIIVTRLGSSVEDEPEIFFSNAEGSVMPCNTHNVAGKVMFRGGIRFRKQSLQFIVTNFVFDIKSGAITATMDTVANRPFGMIDTTAGEFIKMEGSTVANIILRNRELLLDEGFLSIVNKKLGTQLYLQDEKIPSDVAFRLPLTIGSKLNRELIVALRLDGDIDLNMTVAEFVNLTLVLAVQLK